MRKVTVKNALILVATASARNWLTYMLNYIAKHLRKVNREKGNFADH